MNAKGKLLLASSIIGFAWWTTLLVSVIVFLRTVTGDVLIELGNIKIGFFEGIKTFIKNFSFNEAREIIKWLLVLFTVFLALTASWVLNIIGWKKGKNTPVIIAAGLYLLSLNFIPMLLCVIGLLWDSKDEHNTQLKKNSHLLIMAGILGILFMAFWLIPLIQRKDGSGIASLFTALLSTVSDPDGHYLFTVIALNYSIAFMASFMIAIPLSLFGILRNNTKKVLIPAILYIISLSIPSAILCFISYTLLRTKRYVEFCEKHPVKNKLLLYTMIYTVIFNGALIIVFAFIDTLPFFIYLISATGIGLILNFFAWKTNIKKLKIFSSLAYILGIFTIISAVLCFVSCFNWKQFRISSLTSASSAFYISIPCPRF
jgi:hypothetical protein